MPQAELAPAEQRGRCDRSQAPRWPVLAGLQDARRGNGNADVHTIHPDSRKAHLQNQY